MAVILLVLTLAALVLAVAIGRERLGVGNGLREALVVAAAIWGGLLVALTELLSALALLSYAAVLTGWLVILVGLLSLVYRYRARLRGWLVISWPGSAWDWTLLILCLGLLAAAGVAAVLLPVNNYDSMIYHFPRQIRWLQQGSVAHFATPYPPQTEWPPFAEFVGLHLMILSGGDAWANLPQWLSLGLTLVVVSLIGRELGLNRRGQLLAAVFVVTNPLAVLQGFSTKNELITSFWFCSAAWWCLRLWAGKPWSLVHAFFFGLALGLMALTKGTGYLFAIPLTAGAGLGLLLKQRAVVIPALALAAGVALLLNTGHWARNYFTYGSLLGSGYTVVHSNETVEPRAVASNVIRNVALHLGSSSRSWNCGLTNVIARVHGWLGIDMNDPRINLFPEFCGPFSVRKPTRDEATSPAPIHAVCLVALALLSPLWLRRYPPTVWVALGLSVACFVMFCAGTKWQPWHARLHLPTLCLGGAVLACFCLSRFRPAVQIMLVAGMVWLMLPHLFKGEYKSLSSIRRVLRGDRLGLMFVQAPHLREGTCTIAALAAQHHPRTIGLPNFAILPCGFNWEYPLERFILDQGIGQPYFAPFETAFPVRGPHGPHDTAPDLAIGVCATDAELIHPETATHYLAVEQALPYTIYVPADELPHGSPENWPLAFIGWQALEGWTDVEFADAKKNQPAVRWGRAPESRLCFEARGLRMLLVAECRGAWPDEVVTIRLNGTEIGRHALTESAGFDHFCLSLETQPGRNELTFEYAGGDTASPSDRGALFRKLVILPIPGGAHSEAPRSESLLAP